MAAMVAALNLTDGEAASNLAHDHAQVVPISIFAAVLCLCLLFGHLFEGNRWLNESIVAIVVVIDTQFTFFFLYITQIHGTNLFG